MSILRFIAQQKDKFQQQSAERQKAKIKSQTEQLKVTQVRQAELKKVNQEYAATRKEVDALKGYNDKIEASRPSKLKAIGQGLSKAMAATKTHLSNVKAKGVSKGTARQMQKLGNYNQGSSIQFGMQNEKAQSNPFDFKAGKEKSKNKGPWEF